MEELAKALAEAVRQGSALAGPALIGYYAVRVVEAFSAPLAFIGFALIAAGVIKQVTKRFWDYYEKEGAKGR